MLPVPPPTVTMPERKHASSLLLLVDTPHRPIASYLLHQLLSDTFPPSERVSHRRYTAAGLQPPADNPLTGASSSLSDSSLYLRSNVSCANLGQELPGIRPVDASLQQLPFMLDHPSSRCLPQAQPTRPLIPKLLRGSRAHGFPLASAAFLYLTEQSPALHSTPVLPSVPIQTPSRDIDSSCHVRFPNPLHPSLTPASGSPLSMQTVTTPTSLRENDVPCAAFTVAHNASGHPASVR